MLVATASGAERILDKSSLATLDNDALAARLMDLIAPALRTGQKLKGGLPQGIAITPTDRTAGKPIESITIQIEETKAPSGMKGEELRKLQEQTVKIIKQLVTVNFKDAGKVIVKLFPQASPQNPISSD
jgi:hypothetical protein